MRLLLDVMGYFKRNNKSSVSTFLDFEKAFDSLNWKLIHKCLLKMGMRKQFCKWIKTICTYPKALAKRNGFLSETIRL